MGLAQDQDMVEAFSPDRADEPFYVSVLPGRAGRGWLVANGGRHWDCFPKVQRCGRYDVTVPSQSYFGYIFLKPVPILLGIVNDALR
jgi:hypothetical protein